MATREFTESERFFFEEYTSQYVWEQRARYKVFHYQMTNNSLITVIDRRLGFYIDELKKVHAKQIGYSKFYIIDTDKLTAANVYILQRF